jgi:hypothetical protein
VAAGVIAAVAITVVAVWLIRRKRQPRHVPGGKHQLAGNTSPDHELGIAICGSGVAGGLGHGKAMSPNIICSHGGQPRPLSSATDPLHGGLSGNGMGSGGLSNPSNQPAPHAPEQLPPWQPYGAADGSQPRRPGHGQGPAGRLGAGWGMAPAAPAPDASPAGVARLAANMHLGMRPHAGDMHTPAQVGDFMGGAGAFSGHWGGTTTVVTSTEHKELPAPGIYPPPGAAGVMAGHWGGVPTAVMGRSTDNVSAVGPPTPSALWDMEVKELELKQASHSASGAAVTPASVFLPSREPGAQPPAWVTTLPPADGTATATGNAAAGTSRWSRGHATGGLGAVPELAIAAAAAGAGAGAGAPVASTTKSSGSGNRAAGMVARAGSEAGVSDRSTPVTQSQVRTINASSAARTCACGNWLSSTVIC